MNHKQFRHRRLQRLLGRPDKGGKRPAFWMWPKETVKDLPATTVQEPKESLEPESWVRRVEVLD